MRGVNEYDSILQELDEEFTGRVSRSVYGAVDVDPDQESGLHKIARRSGIPVEALRLDNGAEAKRRVAVQDVEALPETSPRTAEFLSDPENSKLAWDDVQALAKVEGLFKKQGGSPTDVMGIATAQDRANARGMRDVVSAAATGLYSSPEKLQKGFASTGRLLAGWTAWGLQALGMEQGAAIWQGAADTAKESADIWGAGAKAKLSPTTPGTLPSYVQQAAQSVGVSALAAPFGLAGEGSALTMFALSADDNYDELKQAGVSTPLAIALSLSGKSMEGLTEKIGMDALYQGGKPLVKRMTSFVLRDLLGEEVNTVYGAIADKVTVKPDMTLADLGQRVLDTAIVTALAGPMQGVIFDAPARGAQYLADSMASSARAQETRQVMAALGEAATESKLQTRLPDRFRDFVRMVREDGPVENAYIPAAEWRTYWQDKNVDPQGMADDVTADGGRQYLEALATGGDMVIPIEVYAEKLAATEHHTDLSQHVRLRQGDMTLAESEAFEAERDARVQELVEQVRAEAEVATVNRPSWLKVYDDLFGQLQGVFPRDTAEKYATLGAVRARTRAERLGLDAFDLYNEQPLKIGRPLPEALRQRTVDTGIDPFLDRLRAADIPTDETIFGQSLLQFVRERGVADDRGELAQMEVDATRKPGQRNIIRPDGMALDKVREAAVESGYLPEGATVNDLLTAIDNEMRGNPVYSTRPIDDRAFETRATLDQLRDELDRRGIDLNQMDNETVRRQMFQGEQGGELWQSLPEKIEIDGIDRWAVNSNGQPIAQTEEGVRNFWRWFGDSKVVDDEGRPLVVYHNTDEKRTVFDLNKARKNVEIQAHYFAPEPDSYGEYGPVQNDVYLKITKPADYATAYTGFDASRNEEGVKQRQQLQSDGYDGGIMSEDGKPYEYFVFDSKNIKSVFNSGQFDSGNPNILYQGQRGFIRFTPDAREIGILENANLSTFIHELGHSWLEELKQDAERPDAPEQVKQDWALIQDWLKVNGEITVEQHEQFARAAEAYTMEGKAPTVELQSVFQRFKLWMMQIYRTLRGLNVDLSDEVRGVFDRLLASDAEIQVARNGLNMAPVFATAEMAGMTEAEFAAYQKTAADANAAESARLEQKLMADLTREQKAWWKEQRDAMQEEVEREAKQNPVYEALRIIINGEDFDGNKPERPIKIDRDTLVQMYGKEFLKRLPRGFGRIYATEGGLHPDAVAEIFGFSSGDEMIRRMIEAPKMRDWVESETDIRMREKHGDLLNDGGLADEALKAIHEGDERAQVLAAELRAIRRKQREVAPFMQAQRDAARQSDADRRTMQESIPPLSYFRSVAAATIAEKEIRHLEPHLYYRAEQKAAKEAFDAAAKGDWATAGEAKYRQLLNHHLYREAQAAKEETDKIRDYLTKMGEAKNLRRVGQAGQSFLVQIQGLLERFDLSRISNAQIDRSLQEFLDDLFEETGLDVPVDEAIGNERYRKNWKELTVDEFRALNDSVKAIEHAAREVSKVQAGAAALFLEEAEEMLVDQAERANEKEVKQFLTRSSMTLMDKASDELRKFDQMILRPERIIEWLDGGESGPWHDLLWNKAVEADNKRNDLRASLLPQLQNIMETVTKRHGQRLREVYHVRELGTDMSISEMIGVALNVGNDSNREKLMKGGVYVGAERRMIDALALDEILKHLKKEEWEMVQGLWDAVNSLWPQIAELETRRSGLPPVKVEATPITNEHGTFAGGYWPAVYDPRHSRQGEKQSDANRVDAMYGANFSKASTRKGHTKERVQNFARPMNLDWQVVVSRHVDNVITDLSHWQFVFDVRRLLSRDGVRKAVQLRIGDTAFRSLEGWLKYTVQADYYGDPAAGVFQNWRQRAVSNLAVAALGFKVATAAGNLVVAPVQAADRVGPKFIARGLGEFLRNPKAAVETAAALSGQMKHRANEVDKTFQETLNKLAGNDSIRARIARASMAIHLWVDKIGSTAIWLGAYREAQANGLDGLDAVRHADKSIRMTQTAGAPKDLSAFERDPRYQEFKLFLGPMLIMGNGIRSQFREKGLAVAWSPEAWGKLFALWFGPAILFELVVGRGPDGDDDEGWAAWGLRRLLLYPFQTIPVIREFANVAEGYFTGKKRDVRNLPIYEAGAAVLDAVNKTYRATQDEVEPEKAVKSVASATGLAVGLPTQQLTVTGEFLYDVLTGQYEPEAAYSPLRDIFLRRKEK